VAFDAIRDEIFLNEPAVFELTIYNNNNVEENYRITIEDFVAWSVQTDPISHRLSGITVGSGQSETTTLILHPREVKPGRTAVQVAVKKEGSNQQISKLLRVNVREIYKIPIIEPKLELIVSFSEGGKFDPRKENLAQIEIKNKNQLDIEDLTLTVRSSLIDETRTGIALQPLERKKEGFILNFDLMQEPVKDSLVVTAFVKNVSFVQIANYEVVAYTTAFNEEHTTKESFLKTSTSIDVTNIANSRKDDTVSYGTSFWMGIFTSTKPKANVIEESGSKLLRWNVALEPGESTQLRITINYRPLFYMFILLVILVMAYYALRSQLVLHKQVMRVSRKEGGISEIKVVMNVRNRGNGLLKEIKVVDKIPNIATLVKQSEVGTLHPSKVIRHTKGASLLKWEIESLEPHEERVINYTIKSRLTILGQFMLPVAVGKYKNNKGKTRKTRSNVLRLGG